VLADDHERTLPGALEVGRERLDPLLASVASAGRLPAGAPGTPSSRANSRANASSCDAFSGSRWSEIAPAFVGMLSTTYSRLMASGCTPSGSRLPAATSASVLPSWRILRRSPKSRL
jgi:hypothetical protein